MRWPSKQATPRNRPHRETFTIVIGNKLHSFQTHHCLVPVAVTPGRARKTLIAWPIFRDLQVERIGRCRLVAATKRHASCGSYESPRQHTRTYTQDASAQKVFCVSSLRTAAATHWACVRCRSPAPQPADQPPPHHRASPLPLPLLGASRSVRPPAAVSPSRRAFTTEMAAKVSRSVLLLSRSSGTVAGSLPALVVSTQRHHQHIRPVSPRTCVCAQGRQRE